MMPGMNKIKGMKDMKVDDKQMGRVEAIVKSMTTEEKRKAGNSECEPSQTYCSGQRNSVQEVNRLIKQFDDMRKMMKQFSGMMGQAKGAKGMKGKMGKGI